MLAEGDLPTTLAWRNHDESRRWFLSTDPITLHDHRAWFERYLQREDDFVFIVDVDDTPRAQVAIYNIVHETAEFGRLLVDPEWRGHGFGHLATTLALRAASEALGLRTLVLEVKRANTPALRAYQRVGFIESDRTDDDVVRMTVELA